MYYRPYEYDRPLCGEDDVAVVLNDTQAARVASLYQRFARLIALEEQFYQKADIRPARLSLKARILAAYETGKNVTHMTAPREPQYLERAWRTNGVRAIVAAKIFSLRYSSPTTAQFRPAHEPYLMKDFHRVAPPRQPVHGLQGMKLKTQILLKKSSAMTPYAPVFLDRPKPDDPNYTAGIPESLFALPLESATPPKPPSRFSKWLSHLMR